MIGRRRRQHEYEPTTPSYVSAIADRPISYLRGEDDPTQIARVESRYHETSSADGGEYNVIELIMGRTLTDKRTTLTLADVDKSLQMLRDGLVGANKVSPYADFAGTYLIEYPRETVEDPIQGVVIMTEASGGKGLYHIQEMGEDKNTIHVTYWSNVKEGQDEATSLDLPRGTRTTISVRGRVPAAGYPVNSPPPTFEEKLMERVRNTVIDLKIGLAET